MSLLSSEAQALIDAATRFVLMATKPNVSGAALASTNLTFESGVSLATHIPLFAIVEYVSGTFGICVLRVDANSLAIAAGLPLATLITGKFALIPVIGTAGMLSTTGSLAANITTASAGASVFNIKIFGLKY